MLLLNGVGMLCYIGLCYMLLCLLDVRGGMAKNMATPCYP
jgi:hypothetical protein